MITMYNIDCMDYMRGLPDKSFELAIVDPPYGIGDRLTDGGHKKNPMEKYRQSYETKRWDSAPDQKYFTELFRVSKNQIIWGGNYFELPGSRGVICWDKKQMMPTFSRWEMAWTSFDSPSTMFEMRPMDNDRFHPTQKPVALYKWLLSRYAKPGDKILDTHGGSGSICIACHDLGYDLTWMELDKDYYDAAVARYNLHASQGQLFEPEAKKIIQKDLL